MGKPRSDTSESRPKSDRASDSGRNKTGPKAGANDRPKSSKDYSSKELKGTGKENFKTARQGHTQDAEQQARREVAKATGKNPKDIKIAGKEKGVQHHHHRDVATGKRLQVNPKVVGEKGTLSAVDTRRGTANYASQGDRPNWNPSKRDRVTHHGQLARIDKYERERTAKAAGVKSGKPTDAARRAYVEGSDTGKWRRPANVDQTERAKHRWEYKEPKGPKLDDKGRVIREQPKAVPQGDAPKTGGPKAGPPKADLSKGPGQAGDVVGRLSRLGRVLGIIGNVFATKRDIERIIAEDKPGMLREGQRLPLDKPMFRGDPIMRVPSGYTVEKTGGKIIYRNSKGEEVSKDEALGASDPDRPTEA